MSLSKTKQTVAYPTEQRVEHLLHRLLRPIAIRHQDRHVLLKSSTRHRVGIVRGHFEQSVSDIG